jgi:hypothetical protein
MNFRGDNLALDSPSLRFASESWASARAFVAESIMPECLAASRKAKTTLSACVSAKPSFEALFLTWSARISMSSLPMGAGNLSQSSCVIL